MNKETKKIIDLLGNGTFLDNVFKFSKKGVCHINECMEDLESIFENYDYLYTTNNCADYWLIGVAGDKLIKFSADSEDDIDFHHKEEFYLIPFYLFSNEYSGNESLKEMTYGYYDYSMKRSLKLGTRVYDYSLDLLKYICWYKEQGYPIYDYITKLELFLKEKIELWKIDYEKIKNKE